MIFDVFSNQVELFFVNLLFPIEPDSLPTPPPQPRRWNFTFIFIGGACCFLALALLIKKIRYWKRKRKKPHGRRKSKHRSSSQNLSLFGRVVQLFLSGLGRLPIASRLVRNTTPSLVRNTTPSLVRSTPSLVRNVLARLVRGAKRKFGSDDTIVFVRNTASRLVLMAAPRLGRDSTASFVTDISLKSANEATPMQAGDIVVKQVRDNATAQVVDTLSAMGDFETSPICQCEETMLEQSTCSDFAIAETRQYSHGNKVTFSTIPTLIKSPDINRLTDSDSEESLTQHQLPLTKWPKESLVDSKEYVLNPFYCKEGKFSKNQAPSLTIEDIDNQRSPICNPKQTLNTGNRRLSSQYSQSCTYKNNPGTRLNLWQHLGASGTASRHLQRSPLWNMQHGRAAFSQPKPASKERLRPVEIDYHKHSRTHTTDHCQSTRPSNTESQPRSRTAIRNAPPFVRRAIDPSDKLIYQHGRMVSPGSSECLNISHSESEHTISASNTFANSATQSYESAQQNSYNRQIKRKKSVRNVSDCTPQRLLPPNNSEVNTSRLLPPSNSEVSTSRLLPPSNSEVSTSRLLPPSNSEVSTSRLLPPSKQCLHQTGTSKATHECDAIHTKNSVHFRNDFSERRPATNKNVQDNPPSDEFKMAVNKGVKVRVDNERRRLYGLNRSELVSGNEKRKRAKSRTIKDTQLYQITRTQNKVTKNTSNVKAWDLRENDTDGTNRKSAPFTSSLEEAVHVVESLLSLTEVGDNNSSSRDALATHTERSRTFTTWTNIGGAEAQAGHNSSTLCTSNLESWIHSRNSLESSTSLVRRAALKHTKYSYIDTAGSSESPLAMEKHNLENRIDISMDRLKNSGISSMHRSILTRDGPSHNSCTIQSSHGSPPSLYDYLSSIEDTQQVLTERGKFNCQGADVTADAHTRTTVRSSGKPCVSSRVLENEESPTEEIIDASDRDIDSHSASPSGMLAQPREALDKTYALPRRFAKPVLTEVAKDTQPLTLSCDESRYITNSPPGYSKLEALSAQRARETVALTDNHLSHKTDLPTPAATIPTKNGNQLPHKLSQKHALRIAAKRFSEQVTRRNSKCKEAHQNLVTLTSGSDKGTHLTKKELPGGQSCEQNGGRDSVDVKRLPGGQSCEQNRGHDSVDVERLPGGQSCEQNRGYDPVDVKRLPGGQNCEQNRGHDSVDVERLPGGQSCEQNRGHDSMDVKRLPRGQSCEQNRGHESVDVKRLPGGQSCEQNRGHDSVDVKRLPGGQSCEQNRGHESVDVKRLQGGQRSGQNALHDPDDVRKQMVRRHLQKRVTISEAREGHDSVEYHEETASDETLKTCSASNKDTSAAGHVYNGNTVKCKQSGVSTTNSCQCSQACKPGGTCKQTRPPHNTEDRCVHKSDSIKQGQWCVSTQECASNTKAQQTTSQEATLDSFHRNLGQVENDTGQTRTHLNRPQVVPLQARQVKSLIPVPIRLRHQNEQVEVSTSNRTELSSHLEASSRPYSPPIIPANEQVAILLPDTSAQPNSLLVPSGHKVQPETHTKKNTALEIPVNPQHVPQQSNVDSQRQDCNPQENRRHLEEKRNAKPKETPAKYLVHTVGHPASVKPAGPEKQAKQAQNLRGSTCSSSTDQCLSPRSTASASSLARQDAARKDMPSHTSRHKSQDTKSWKHPWRGTNAFRKRIHCLIQHNKDTRIKEKYINRSLLLAKGMGRGFIDNKDINMLVARKDATKAKSLDMSEMLTAFIEERGFVQGGGTTNTSSVRGSKCGNGAGREKKHFPINLIRSEIDNDSHADLDSNTLNSDDPFEDLVGNTTGEKARDKQKDNNIARPVCLLSAVRASVMTATTTSADKSLSDVSSRSVITELGRAPTAGPQHQYGENKPGKIWQTSQKMQLQTAPENEIKRHPVAPSIPKCRSVNEIVLADLLQAHSQTTQKQVHVLSSEFYEENVGFVTACDQDSLQHGRNQGSLPHGRDQGSLQHGCDQGSLSHGRDQGSLLHGRNQGSLPHGRDQGSLPHGRDQGSRPHGRNQGLEHAVAELMMIDLPKCNQSSGDVMDVPETRTDALDVDVEEVFSLGKSAIESGGATADNVCLGEITRSERDASELVEMTLRNARCQILADTTARDAARKALCQLELKKPQANCDTLIKHSELLLVSPELAICGPSDLTKDSTGGTKRGPSIGHARRSLSGTYSAPGNNLNQDDSDMGKKGRDSDMGKKGRDSIVDKKERVSTYSSVHGDFGTTSYPLSQSEHAEADEREISWPVVGAMQVRDKLCKFERDQINDDTLVPTAEGKGTLTNDSPLTIVDAESSLALAANEYSKSNCLLEKTTGVKNQSTRYNAAKESPLVIGQCRPRSCVKFRESTPMSAPETAQSNYSYSDCQGKTTGSAGPGQSGKVIGSHSHQEIPFQSTLAQLQKNRIEETNSRTQLVVNMPAGSSHTNVLPAVHDLTSTSHVKTLLIVSRQDIVLKDDNNNPAPSGSPDVDVPKKHCAVDLVDISTEFQLEGYDGAPSERNHVSCLQLKRSPKVQWSTKGVHELAHLIDVGGSTQTQSVLPDEDCPRPVNQLTGEDCPRPVNQLTGEDPCIDAVAKLDNVYTTTLKMCSSGKRLNIPPRTMLMPSRHLDTPLLYNHSSTHSKTESSGLHYITTGNQFLTSSIKAEAGRRMKGREPVKTDADATFSRDSTSLPSSRGNDLVDEVKDKELDTIKGRRPPCTADGCGNVSQSPLDKGADGGQENIPESLRAHETKITGNGQLDECVSLGGTARVKSGPHAVITTHTFEAALVVPGTGTDQESGNLFQRSLEENMSQGMHSSENSVNFGGIKVQTNDKLSMANERATATPEVHNSSSELNKSSKEDDSFFGKDSSRSNLQNKAPVCRTHSQKFYRHEQSTTRHRSGRDASQPKKCLHKIQSELQVVDLGFKESETSAAVPARRLDESDLLHDDSMAAPRVESFGAVESGASGISKLRLNNATVENRKELDNTKVDVSIPGKVNTNIKCIDGAVQKSDTSEAKDNKDYVRQHLDTTSALKKSSRNDGRKANQNANVATLSRRYELHGNHEDRPPRKGIVNKTPKENENERNVRKKVGDLESLLNKEQEKTKISDGIRKKHDDVVSTQKESEERDETRKLSRQSCSRLACNLELHYHFLREKDCSLKGTLPSTKQQTVVCSSDTRQQNAVRTPDTRNWTKKRPVQLNQPTGFGKLEEFILRAEDVDKTKLDVPMATQITSLEVGLPTSRTKVLSVSSTISSNQNGDLSKQIAHQSNVFNRKLPVLGEGDNEPIQGNTDAVSPKSAQTIQVQLSKSKWRQADKCSVTDDKGILNTTQIILGDSVYFPATCQDREAVRRSAALETSLDELVCVQAQMDGKIKLATKSSTQERTRREFERSPVSDRRDGDCTNTKSGGTCAKLDKLSLTRPPAQRNADYIVASLEHGGAGMSDSSSSIVLSWVDSDVVGPEVTPPDSLEPPDRRVDKRSETGVGMANHRVHDRLQDT